MATHVHLKAVEEFLRNKTYPKGILKDKGKKSNFRKACKNFSIVNGDLMYKEKRRAVFEVERRTYDNTRCTRRNRRQFNGQSLGSSPWP